MASTRAPDHRNAGESSGIALFLVIAALAVLSILVTEFTYVAQINQKIAFDAQDQVKVHYLAKSGFKLSLLRLKVYQTLKGLGGAGGSANPAGVTVPKGLLDKIWSYPIQFPISADIPGLSMTEKDQITQFQEATGLEGRFSSAITSESGKFNLNMVLAPYAPESKEKTTKPPASGAAPGKPPAPPAEKETAPTFNPEEARRSLEDYIRQVLQQKFDADPDFASEYRDFQVEDLMDNLFAWVDRTYQRRSPENDTIADKRGPFYSLSELRMIRPMDDALYDVLAPTLTVSPTPGVNVNTMNRNVLQALIPDMSSEELDDFFKFRDSEEDDNLFKTEEDFLKYIGSNVAKLAGPDSMTRLKGDLAKRNIRLVVDETNFKVTVQAKLNESTRVIEAWLTLSSGKKESKTADAAPPTDAGGLGPSDGEEQTQQPKKKGDAGLNVTFMRIL